MRTVNSTVRAITVNAINCVSKITLRNLYTTAAQSARLPTTMCGVTLIFEVEHDGT